ncbi:MAG: hypothetical protein QOD10_4046 [Mycobacterium sp.]|jgi:hypothetical protein|nr:hypothetical protein [Mycobacterium sp.]
MRHITSTISGYRGSHDLEAAAFWIFAGIIVVIAFGDALAVLGVAIAIATVIAWIYSKVERRLERSDEAMAPVAHLRPELTGKRDPKTSADAPWHGPRAA